MAKVIDRKIAELRGWTDFWMHGSFLMGISPAELSMGVEAERAEVPLPSTNRADALELLEYVCALSHVGDATIIRMRGNWGCLIACDSGDTDPELLGEGRADTLAEAITIACRDAMIALREAQPK